MCTPSEYRPPRAKVEDTLDLIRSFNNARPFVMAQLGQSLDGRIALPSGESRYINGSAALDHLHRLRAAVDAVVVGIGTVIADDPQLTVRRTPGRNPARVIIDPNGRLPLSCRCLENNGAPVIVLRKAGCDAPPPKVAEIVELHDTGQGLACAEIIRSLVQMGFGRILIEGGPTTISRFFEERQLDRLHVLIGPVFLGQGMPGLNFTPPADLASAIRVTPHVYPLDGGEVLIDCPLARVQGAP